MFKGERAFKKKSKTLQMKGLRDGQITKQHIHRSRKNIAPLHSNTYVPTQPSLRHNNTLTTLLNIILC